MFFFWLNSIFLAISIVIRFWRISYNKVEKQTEKSTAQVQVWNNLKRLKIILCKVSDYSISIKITTRVLNAKKCVHMT